MSNITTQSWNAAVAEQFPFLSSTLSRLTHRAEIGKVSDELLDLTPREHYGTNLSGFQQTDCIELWDRDGKFLGDVSAQITHADARDTGGDQDGETVGDAIARLEDPTTLGFITRYQVYEGGVLAHDPDTREMDIFKVADFDLSAWVTRRKEVAAQAVKSATV